MSEAKVIAEHPSGVVAGNLRRIDKGAVIGAVEISIPAWHLKINCLWLSNDKGEWVALPTEKFTDREGKTIYRRLVEFTNDQAHDRFQAAALAAVRRLT